MRILIAILSLTILFSSNRAEAIDLTVLLRGLAKNSAAAKKHADDVLRTMPKETKSQSTIDGIDQSRTTATGLRNALANSQCTTTDKACDQTDDPNWQRMVSDALGGTNKAYLIVDGNDVNLRSCPRLSCPSLAKVDRGSYEVRIMSMDNDWIGFEVGDPQTPPTTLYVSRKFSNLSRQ